MIQQPPQFIAEQFTNLQPPVQRLGNGHAASVGRAVRRDGRDERVQLVPLLLELLDQALDGRAGEALRLAALTVVHQTVDDGRAGVGGTGDQVDLGHGGTLKVCLWHKYAARFL